MTTQQTEASFRRREASQRWKPWASGGNETEHETSLKSLFSRRYYCLPSTCVLQLTTHIHLMAAKYKRSALLLWNRRIPPKWVPPLQKPHNF